MKKKAIHLPTASVDVFDIDEFRVRVEVSEGFFRKPDQPVYKFWLMKENLDSFGMVPAKYIHSRLGQENVTVGHYSYCTRSERKEPT